MRNSSTNEMINKNERKQTQQQREKRQLNKQEARLALKTTLFKAGQGNSV